MCRLLAGQYLRNTRYHRRTRWLQRCRRPRGRLGYLPLDEPSASRGADRYLGLGLHAGDRVDTKPTEQGGGVESL
jgi:hypothetical protein